MPAPGKFDAEHFNNLERNAAKVNRLYALLIKEVAKLTENITLDPDVPFDPSKYPHFKAGLDKLILIFSRQAAALIQVNSAKEWDLSDKKNSALMGNLAASTGLSAAQLATFRKSNIQALKAFQNRKIKGMGLSDRVWNYSKQYKKEIETVLDLSLGQGRSAQQIARDLKKYLVNPDSAFRRYRDKNGNLKYGAIAKEYHPGAGIYRSSYKNAMRLSRTENNMAYHASDSLKYKNLPQVIGFEVKLSNTHEMSKCQCEVCELFAGQYPKDFSFEGWHPHCKCTTIPILKSKEERKEDMKRIAQGLPVLESKNNIKTIPEGMKKWLADNKDKIATAKSLPYFLRNNQKYTDPNYKAPAPVVPLIPEVDKSSKLNNRQS